MPRSRDPNYDTTMEYAMDHDTDERILKKDANRKRCQCSNLATIKTTYDRHQVVYHCGQTCKQWWMKTHKPAPLTIDKTETALDGFTA